MAFVRGRLGIEYNTTPANRDEGFRKGPLVAATLGIAVVLLAANTISRKLRKEDARSLAPVLEIVVEPQSKPGKSVAKDVPAKPLGGTIAKTLPAANGRPPRLKQLFDRLEIAEKSGNIDVAIAAIEDIRAYPGGAAADVDDRLARRLGKLNLRRLWELKDPRWVTEVTVRPGDNATRIARANGTTLAAVKKLNETENIDLVKSGTKIKVMRLPRFILVVHLRLKTADLQLNGKFFNRYDIAGAAPDVKSGSFEIKGSAANFLSSHGLVFDKETSKELDTLMPNSSILVVSEM